MKVLKTPVRLFAALALFAIAATPAQAKVKERVVVFAASSLAGVVGDILANAPGNNAASFAGTATLARQIEAGAPADIFISANEHWTGVLEGKGLLEVGSRRAFAGNTLVLVSPAGSNLPDLEPPALLQHGDVKRIAIGETTSVPAGIYANQVLQRLGLEASLKPKLLPATSVRTVMIWTEHGEADLGFVYQSDAHASARIRIRGTFPASETSGLTPVTYSAAILRGQTDMRVLATYDYLFSPEARATLAEHGFQIIP